MQLPNKHINTNNDIQKNLKTIISQAKLTQIRRIYYAFYKKQRLQIQYAESVTQPSPGYSEPKANGTLGHE